MYCISRKSKHDYAMLVSFTRNFHRLLEFSHSTSGGPENDARGAKAGKRGVGQLFMRYGDIQ